MSQDLQTGRYDQLVRRVGGLIGPGSHVSEVLGEAFPTLELEDTTPELIALTGWKSAWQSTERPADALLNSASQIFNPAASGVIATITQVGIWVTPTTAIQAEIDTVQFGTPVAGLFRDSRFGVPRNTTLVVSSADDVAIGGGLRIRAQSGVGIFIRDDNGIVVLTPGTGLSLGTTSVNILMLINYFWRERVAEQSELSFPN